MIFQAVGDFDGDGIWEAAAVYRINEELLVAAYKYDGWAWVETNQWRGTGYAIHAFYAIPSVTRGPGSHSLAVCWQRGYSVYVSVYDWTEGRLREQSRYAYAGPGTDGAGGSWSLLPAAALPVLDQQMDGQPLSEARQPVTAWHLEASQMAAMPQAAEAQQEPGVDQAEARPQSGPAAGLLYPAPLRTVEGTRWGYVDGTGRMVLPPVYDYAFGFQVNGLAVVEQKGRNGVIDRTGRFVAQPVYDSISPFQEGLAVVSRGDGYGVMNEQGRVITLRKYGYVNAYSDGRAMFATRGTGEEPQRYGYLDRNGQEVIPARYLEGTDFRDGKAVVKRKEKEYALINRAGDVLTVYPFAYVGPPGDGLLAYQAELSGKYGYILEKGVIAISPRFTGAQPFEEGRAVVNTAEQFGNRYGLIDRTGRFIIEPAYEDVRLLGEGRVALGKAKDPTRPYIGSRYAIADLDGRMLTDFIYEDVMDYKRGYASVHNRQETFFIDRTGRRAAGLPVVPGTGTLSFEGGLIRAEVDNRLSYLDRSGRVVWAQNTVIPLAPPYQVTERKYKPNPDYLVYYPQVEGMTSQQAQQEVNRKLAELSAVKPVDPKAQLDYSYTGDFGVAFYRNRLLELQLDGYNYPFGAAHGMPSRVYTHTDLVTGVFYGLPDLFKPNSDYLKVLSALVLEQIRNDPQYSYVWLDSYKGVAADQLFHVSPEALHLFFAPYDIAPYAAGFVEFVIPFSKLNEVLNQEGDFWGAFH